MAKFEIGNKAAEKWTEEQAIEAFEKALNNAMDDEDILSVQDAFFSIDMAPNYADHLIKRFSVLEDYKKTINDLIISRVNKEGLKGKFNPTLVIWRCKQLGERDTQYQEVNSTVQQTNIISLGKGKKPD